MKKLILLLLILLLTASPALAFLYDVKVLAVEEIKKLSNEEILTVYIDAKIETKASQTFHINAGFSNPKEYRKYKELLGFIIRLRQEMEIRKVDAPPVDKWLE